MNLSIVIALCKRFEGFRGAPYLCPADVPTIGYGSTYYADGRKVTLQDPRISEPDAEALLLHELEHTYLPAVLRLCPKLTDVKKINALTDFCYNLGIGRLQTSTLRRKVNEEDWGATKLELIKWVRGGGKILTGLVLRRKMECTYF